MTDLALELARRGHVSPCPVCERGPRRLSVDRFGCLYCGVELRVGASPHVEARARWNRYLRDWPRVHRRTASLIGQHWRWVDIRMVGPTLGRGAFLDESSRTYFIVRTGHDGEFRIRDQANPDGTHDLVLREPGRAAATSIGEIPARAFSLFAIAYAEQADRLEEAERRLHVMCPGCPRCHGRRRLRGRALHQGCRCPDVRDHLDQAEAERDEALDRTARLLRAVRVVADEIENRPSVNGHARAARLHAAQMLRDAILGL